jgi:DNA invertase Pin-like site-specific DNA recombinase
MSKFGYKRVSTEDQKTDRQELPADIPAENIFEEKVSGRSRKDRAELAAMIRSLRGGDHVYIHSIDRLGRSLIDLTQLVDEMVSREVTVHFLKENLTFSQERNDITGNLMLQVLGAIAEFERNLIRQRQREGIEKAKRAGKYRGRPTSIDRDSVGQLLKSGLAPAKVARLANIGIASVYRIRRELNGTPDGRAPQT